jgi:hypothetical protein
MRRFLSANPGLNLNVFKRDFNPEFAKFGTDSVARA